MRRLLRFVRRTLAAALVLSAVYLAVLCYPQPLFAYELQRGGIIVHATRPIPPSMAETLDRVQARLQRSGLVPRGDVYHVFLCDSRWLFALFARQNYHVGGIADVFVSQHIFLRESDMERDRLIGPSGRPVAADRPLSYFIAHEIMHVAHGRRVGRLAYARLPRWVDEGHADYTARTIDLDRALQGFKDGVRELDPSRSGLYIRFHLMVAYMLEKRGAEVDTLLTAAPPPESVERDLRALPAWRAE